MIPPQKDIDRCKNYLNNVYQLMGEIQKIKLDNLDTITPGLDGMPRGTKISDHTMDEALHNVVLDERIKRIQKKIYKTQKNISKVLKRYPEEETLMRDIIDGLYIQCKPKSLIQREIKASNETFPMLLTQSYKTYTYYFYRAKKAKERE